MIIRPGAASADIIKASERIKYNDPQLREILSFYETVFCLQEQSYRSLPDLSQALDREKMLIRRNFNFPLVTRPEIPFSDMACLDLLLALCRVGSDAAVQANLAFDRLAARIASPQDFRDLASGYLSESIKFLEKTASDISFTTSNLEFLIYNTLKPSIVRCCESLSPLVQAENPAQGYCPVCGSKPGCSLLDEQGVRHLVCSFCWQRWATPLVFCPFCGTNQNLELSYMVLDDNKKIRGDVCDGCKKSIKTVDLREYTHDIYLPLELLGAIPLDISLSREGYEPGDSWVKITKG
ncbi:MAG: formate dehydrogenase accessory protein FdhE [Pseudomonadota bacterium]